MGDLGILSRQCRQGFENLVLHLTIKEPAEMSAPDIKSQYGKFKVWCGNLGAFQTGYSSLDYRLRESIVMQSTVAKLLRQLSSALIESISVVSGKRLPFEDQPKPADLSEESSDESDSEAEERKPRKELAMRLSSITDCLNSLYRISYKIRNPNLRPSTSKAIYYQEIDPETQKDIFEHFRALDQNHVSELFCLLRKGRYAPDDSAEYLRERLTDSITLRRRCFKYWEKHSKKLSHDTGIGELIPGLDLADMETPFSPKTGEGLSVAEGKNPERRAESTVILSRTDATPYDTALDDRTEKATVVSFTSTALDTDGKGIELPGPPAEAKKGEEFTCPYCHVLCPAKQGRGKAWRQHVLHDLQPYVCTYPDCSQHKELYRSRSQWVKHEDSVHRRCWRCHEHPNIIHKSAASLKRHLATQHSKTLTEEQIEHLTEIYSFTLVDDREHCPICFEKQPFVRGMANHLANHLERIALFSLPRSYADSEGPGSRSEDMESDGTDPRNSLPTSARNHLSPTVSINDRLGVGTGSQDSSVDSLRKLDLVKRIISSSPQKGSDPGRSEEAQCDNCGASGHWAVSCPEPLTSPPVESSTWTRKPTRHKTTSSSNSGNSASAENEPLGLKTNYSTVPHIFFPLGRLRPYSEQVIIQKITELLREYPYKHIFSDTTGHYVIFRHSLHGASEANRCFEEVNFTPILKSNLDAHLSIPKTIGLGTHSDHGQKPGGTSETLPRTDSPWGLKISKEEFERIYGRLDDESEVNLEDLTKELFEKYGDDDWPMRDYAQWIRVMTMQSKTNSVSVPKDLILDSIKQLHEWRDHFRRGPGRHHQDISDVEFKDILERCGYNVSPAVTENLFRKWGLEPRGTYLNFGQYMSSMALIKHITDMFVFLDNDRDGYATVSFEEFLTLFYRAILHLEFS